MTPFGVTLDKMSRTLEKVTCQVESWCIACWRQEWDVRWRSGLLGWSAILEGRRSSSARSSFKHWLGPGAWALGRRKLSLGCSCGKVPAIARCWLHAREEETELAGDSHLEARLLWLSLKVLAFILIFYLLLFVISNPSVKVSTFSRFFNSQMLSQYHVLR